MFSIVSFPTFHIRLTADDSCLFGAMQLGFSIAAVGSIPRSSLRCDSDGCKWVERERYPSSRWVSALRTCGGFQLAGEVMNGAWNSKGIKETRFIAERLPRRRRTRPGVSRVLGLRSFITSTCLALSHKVLSISAARFC